NSTEQRAVAHTLLRSGDATDPGLTSQWSKVQHTLDRIEALVKSVHAGQRCGYSGKPFTDVVNIGIGGSDLGPRMVCRALANDTHPGLTCHFVANVDPTAIGDTLARLDPQTTLILVCSKTFTTEETLTNAHVARQWLLSQIANAHEAAPHLLAVSTNVEAATEFGIDADSIFPMWDWVGGRYSLWSAIGLSCALAVGMDNFRMMLAGAESMDRHYREAPLEANMPVLMALLEIWYVNFLGSQTHAVIPYCEDLTLLPAFLQQLSMESNGKRVDRHGVALDFATAPILWGDVGTNGQHSYHQLLHQGTALCPLDLILPLHSRRGDPKQHRQLLAHCLSQSQALSQGRSLPEARQSLIDRGMASEEADKLAPHLVIPGNRPHSIITMEALDPRTLGALLALYEHKVATQAIIWDINAFDQWGVELGKALSGPMLKRLEGKEGEGYDAATETIIAQYRKT
ncbi:MAG: glucose-6-phosphate isomerase, partial [Halieaceae bacterium]